jgi:YVTN family beta-propeller protein
MRTKLRAVIAAAVAVSAAGTGAVLFPTQTAAAPATGRVYVSNVDGDTVSVIDPLTSTVIATVAVGSEPRNLAVTPDRERVYVPNRFDDNVSVIDTDTNTASAPITDPSFDEPYAIAITPDGAEAWVANKEGGGSSTGSVTVIRTSDDTVVDTIDDPCFVSPEAILANPVLAEVYVVNRQDDSVCVVSTATNAVIDTIAVGNDPRFAVATPDGSSVYVANNGGDVTHIDTADASTSTIDVNGFPRNMAITSDGSGVYAALQNDEIALIDTSDDSVTPITFTGASSTYAVALVESEDRGYVTDESNEVVFAFTLSTSTEITGPGFPITDAGFDTPRAAASFDLPQVVPPTTTTTTPTTTTTAPPAAAQPVQATPQFTG